MTTSKPPPIKYPWFRTYHEMLEDPKMMDCSDSEWGIWSKLLCFAGRQPTRGKIILKSDKKPALKQLAAALRTRSNHLAAFLVRASDKNMIDFELNGNEGYVHLINWNKRQFPSDSSTERTRKWREGKRHSDGTEGEGEGEGDLLKDPAKLAALERELDELIKKMAPHWKEVTGIVAIMRDKKYHPGAIIEALHITVSKDPRNAKSYAIGTANRLSPEYRAQDHQERTQELFPKQ